MSGDIQLLEVAPSPTGQEVKHELGFDRADSLQKPPRSKRGSKTNDADFDLEHTDSEDVSVSINDELQSPFNRQDGDNFAAPPVNAVSGQEATLNGGTIKTPAQSITVDVNVDTNTNTDTDTDTNDFDDISQY